MHQWRREDELLLPCPCLTSREAGGEEWWPDGAPAYSQLGQSCQHQGPTARDVVHPGKHICLYLGITSPIQFPELSCPLKRQTTNSSPVQPRNEVIADKRGGSFTLEEGSSVESLRQYITTHRCSDMSSIWHAWYLGKHDQEDTFRHSEEVFLKWSSGRRRQRHSCQSNLLQFVLGTSLFRFRSVCREERSHTWLPTLSVPDVGKWHAFLPEWFVKGALMASRILCGLLLGHFPSSLHSCVMCFCPHLISWLTRANAKRCHVCVSSQRKKCCCEQIRTRVLLNLRLRRKKRRKKKENWIPHDLFWHFCAALLFFSQMTFVFH